MLVSPLDPNFKVVAAINSVVTSAFSGMLFDFFYRNYLRYYVRHTSIFT